MRRWSDRLAVFCAAISVLCVIVVVIVVAPVTIDTARLARENEQRIRDVAALTRENVRLTQQINDERAHNVLVNCRDINRRHDNAIRKLEQLVHSRRGAERVRAERNLAGTVALLDAIVPKRDCAALAREQVPSNTP